MPIPLLILLLLLPSPIVLSQTIIHTLPGFLGALPFKLETGYVGVGEKDAVQLFYYFVESERNPEEDPLILWLAGGPGCSTLRPFFYEIGPLIFKYAEFRRNIPALELNPYSWTKVTNVIFLDQPAGTGYSYATTPDAYKSSDTISAALIHDFIRKWLVIHPNFRSNPLYISGISYLGMVVPIVVQEIYNGNEAGIEPLLNIKGYVLCNPLTDKNGDVNSRVPYANRVALLSDELYKATRASCNGNYIKNDPNNVKCADNLKLVNKCTERINFQNILEPLCASGRSNAERNLLEWEKSSHHENRIDLLRSQSQLSEPFCRGNNYLYCDIWANDQSVQRALHVREGTVTKWLLCNATIEYEAGLSSTISYSFNVPTAVPYHRNLTNKRCRALIVSGDQDMVVPHISTEGWIHSLNLTANNIWEPWFVDGQVGGYKVTYSHNEYSLTYSTLKGAGHTGPEHKPNECLALVDRWFAYSSTDQRLKL